MVDKTINKVYHIAHGLKQQELKLREELGESKAPKLIDDDLYYAILEMKDEHISNIDFVGYGENEVKITSKNWRV